MKKPSRHEIWQLQQMQALPLDIKIYDTGYSRTGCIFCMFGAHLEKEPNRFQRLKITHPKLWAYCLKPKSQGGLGMRKILDFINVPYVEGENKENE